MARTTAFVIGSIAITFSPSLVHAVGDVYFPEATDITLASVSYVIAAGSDADEIRIDGPTLTVIISPGQTFTLTSPDRKKLPNSHGYTYICSETQSVLILTVPNGQSPRSIAITPESTCSTATPGAVLLLTTPLPQIASIPAATAPSPITRLNEGVLIGAAPFADPNIFVINEWKYKRLFLNPAIFSFYGHLHGFTDVEHVTPLERDTFNTSLLLRNCESNSPKIYILEVTGEDTGVLHWLNISGGEAVGADPNFFKKVFCMNSREFRWYRQSTSYQQIPSYARD